MLRLAEAFLVRIAENRLNDDEEKEVKHIAPAKISEYLRDFAAKLLTVCDVIANWLEITFIVIAVSDKYLIFRKYILLRELTSRRYKQLLLVARPLAQALKQQTGTYLISRYDAQQGRMSWFNYRAPNISDIYIIFPIGADSIWATPYRFRNGHYLYPRGFEQHFEYIEIDGSGELNLKVGIYQSNDCKLLL